MSDLKFWQPPVNITKLNCSGLGGVKLTYICNGELKPVVIGGVDPYVGISIVNEKNEPEMCLHGPFDPYYREKYLPEYGEVRAERLQEKYGPRFEIFLAYLREVVEGDGVFFEEEFVGRLENLSPRYKPLDTASAGVCPYGV